MRHHFADVKGVDSFVSLGADRSYLVLDAIDPPVTLGDLLLQCSEHVKVPSPLVYDLFFTFIPVLIFLKDEVQWAHNDVNEDNIICRLYEGCPFEMPEFVIVDFGMVYSIESVKNDSGDCKSLFGLVKKLAEGADKSCDQHWLGCKRILDGEMNRTRWQAGNDLASTRNTWVHVVATARSKRKVEEVSTIEKLFEKVTHKKGRFTDEMVVKAVHSV